MPVNLHHFSRDTTKGNEECYLISRKAKGDAEEEAQLATVLQLSAAEMICTDLDWEGRSYSNTTRQPFRSREASLLVSLLAPYLDAQSTIRLMSANGALSRSQDVCLDTTSKIRIDHFWAFISVRWSSTFSVGQVWLSDGLKGGENKLVWRSPAYGALGTWTRVSQPNLRACGPPPAGPRSELGAGQAPCHTVEGPFQRGTRVIVSVAVQITRCFHS